MKMEPITTHRMAGNHPNAVAAMMGPTMGPAPAMEEK
jgi:hypothetical protein